MEWLLCLQLAFLSEVEAPWHPSREGGRDFGNVCSLEDISGSVMSGLSRSIF